MLSPNFLMIHCHIFDSIKHLKKDSFLLLLYFIKECHLYPDGVCKFKSNKELAQKAGIRENRVGAVLSELSGKKLIKGFKYKYLAKQVKLTFERPNYQIDKKPFIKIYLHELTAIGGNNHTKIKVYFDLLMELGGKEWAHICTSQNNLGLTNKTYQRWVREICKEISLEYKEGTLGKFAMGRVKRCQKFLKEMSKIPKKNVRNSQPYRTYITKRKNLAMYEGLGNYAATISKEEHSRNLLAEIRLREMQAMGEVVDS